MGLVPTAVAALDASREVEEVGLLGLGFFTNLARVSDFQVCTEYRRCFNTCNRCLLDVRIFSA